MVALHNTQVTMPAYALHYQDKVAAIPYAQYCFSFVHTNWLVDHATSILISPTDLGFWQDTWLIMDDGVCVYMKLTTCSEPVRIYAHIEHEESNWT